MRPRPVIWKPRYATRRMRERAWAQADARREQTARATAGPPVLRRAAMSLRRLLGRNWKHES